MADLVDTNSHLSPAVAAPKDTIGAALVAREAQEVQAAVISAKRFPRDEAAAFKKIIKACGRSVLAEDAVYAYERGKQLVSGPTIRLAEVIAQAWGNMHIGVREVGREPGSSIGEAYCWDIETNVRSSKIFVVQHVRDTKKGPVPLTDERDIYEMVANVGARRLRNCILALIPGDIVDAAVTECERTVAQLHGEKDRVPIMLAAFEKFGVSKEDIERRIGKRVDVMSPPDFVQLKRIYKSIQDRMSTAAEWFSKGETTAKTPPSVIDNDQ